MHDLAAGVDPGVGAPGARDSGGAGARVVRARTVGQGAGHRAVGPSWAAKPRKALPS